MGSWLFRFQNGPKTPEERRWKRFLLGFLGAYAVVAFLLMVFVPAVGKLTPLFGLVLVILGVGKEKREVAPVYESGPGEGFSVSVSVVDQHGVTRGLDKGWLIFSEGWLLFEGARTSFAVTRGEARGKVFGMQLSLTLEDRRNVQFTVAPERQDALLQGHREWNLAPIPDGEALLPPVDVHPLIWADRWTLCVFGAVAFGVVTGFGIGFGYWWVVAVSSMAVIACLCSAAYYVRRLRRELLRVFETSVLSSSMQRSFGQRDGRGVV